MAYFKRFNMGILGAILVAIAIGVFVYQMSDSRSKSSWNYKRNNSSVDNTRFASRDLGNSISLASDYSDIQQDTSDLSQAPMFQHNMFQPIEMLKSTSGKRYDDIFSAL